MFLCNLEKISTRNFSDYCSHPTDSLNFRAYLFLIAIEIVWLHIQTIQFVIRAQEVYDFFFNLSSLINAQVLNSVIWWLYYEYRLIISQMNDYYVNNRTKSKLKLVILLLHVLTVRYWTIIKLWNIHETIVSHIELYFSWDIFQTSEFITVSCTKLYERNISNIIIK